MNYYERYCGDYGRDTAHLSLTEHGAYTLMLDAQYSTEAGLPGPYAALCRICRAMTKIEQVAVKAVADQFFPVGADGLRWNRRAQRDLAEAVPRIAAARDNGRHGGRPRKNPVGYEKETHEKPSGLPSDNPVGYPVGYPVETQPGEASPCTTPQAPEDQKQNIPSLQANGSKKPETKGTRMAVDALCPDEWRDYAVEVYRLPAVKAVRLFLEFRDYWADIPGQRGLKIRWFGTFKNRLRDLHEKGRF